MVPDIKQRLSTRLLADGNISIEDAFEEIKNLIDAAWGIGKVRFVDDEPMNTDPENIQLPTITYDIVQRVPSEGIKMGNKPRAFHKGIDPDNPDDTIEVYRQWFDCTVRFELWARNNKELRQLVNAFEELLLTFTGHLKRLGIQDIVFISEGIDAVSNKLRQDAVTTALRYLFRIERTTIVRSKKIKEVEARVHINRKKTSSEAQYNLIEDSKEE